MIKIKICGIQTIDDIYAVNETMPDYAGFVFAESKRMVTPLTVQKISGHLNKAIKKVGVFVNPVFDELLHISAMAKLDMIQLHGDESPGFIRELRKRSNLKIIKAIHVKGSVCEQDLEHFDADYFLFDTYSEKAYGGIGESFDLSLIKNIKNKNVILAGGLNSNNISEKLKYFNPFMVDISSGAETNGAKDKDKIKKIISLVRGKTE